MKRIYTFLVVAVLTLLMSGTAFGAIRYIEDFESFPVNDGTNMGDLGGGWLLFVNVFADSPTCDPFLYNYGQVFPAPNRADAISNIVEGDTGKALNVFSDYANGDHANGHCIETNIFQERTVQAGDTGSYSFRFETQAPGDLGEDVQAFGFIKILDPNNGYATTYFETVDTATPGAKILSVTLNSATVGQIVQWGFANVASNYEDSGRYYDNVTFAVQGSGAYEGDAIGVPIPFWATLIIAVLLTFFGVAKLRARKSV